MGDVLASAPFTAGVEMRLAPPQPVQTQHVMLWIPQLPQDDGKNVARIAEIRVE